MKQFQKYGVAAAVASIATGALAQSQAISPTVSSVEAGDLAIVPYYTVLDGKNTGVHIINTTTSTQVVKVRLRRGADSKDALDFDLVMSPRDEWTANIAAGPNGGVRVSTNDTTCTVPQFNGGGKYADMPATYATGAEEGYIEIIGMAQAVSELQGLAVAAEHATTGATAGVPASCATVRQHFYRVPKGSVGVGSVRGVHTSNLVSSGACTTAAVKAATAGVCSISAGVGAADTAGALLYWNRSDMTDTSGRALKVSYMITDSTEGLEAGDNAFHVENFSQHPMMTNQQPLSFGTAGVLEYDPLNFELPNLAYGAYPSSVALRQAAGAKHGSATTAGAVTAIADGTLFTDLRAAIDTQALLNDWANAASGDATVATDWVVTLPGQYVMNNNICDMLDKLPGAVGTANCSYATASAPGSGTTSLTTAQRKAFDQDELPLTLAANIASPVTEQKARLLIWDREEKPLNSVIKGADPDLGFSPGGVAGDPTDTISLNREVNVIVFGEEGSAGVLGSADDQKEDLGLKTYADYDGKGWGELQIEPVNTTPQRWTVGTEAPAKDDDPINPNLNAGFGEFVAVESQTPAIGFAIWERNFANQAGNYGRLVEHTTVVSSGATRAL